MSGCWQGWTKNQAERHLAENGIVWDMGQLSPEVRRHLDKIGHRQRALWPWFDSGTIEKTCWTKETP